MNENELLKNFAKLLGPAGEDVLQGMEEKRAKEEKFLESLAAALGPESKKALNELNEKEALEKQIREEKILKKKQEVEEQRAKEEKLLRELNNSLSRLIDNNQDQLPLIAQEISQTIADVNAEIAEEPVMGVTATVEAVVEDLQPLPQLPVDDIVNQTVMALSKATPDAVQDVADAIPDGFRKELDIIKKSIADLHRMASRHSQMGGGGEVWLKKLDDVSYQSVSAATDGQVLTFDADINKWIAADPTGGGGVSGQGYYASAYYYDGNVHITDTSVEYVVPINTFAANNGVILNSNSEIIPLYSGTYEITFSIQFVNTDNSQSDVDVWVRQNYIDDSFSNSRFTVPARKNASIPGYLIATTPIIINCTANQKIQLMFASDSTGIFIASLPQQVDNPHTTPATPAVIVTFKQIASVIQGYTGSKGDIGYSGSIGIGYTGSKGDLGYTGSAGYIGADGYTGSKGDIGYTGSAGYIGADGYTGSKGDIGYTGSKGDPGDPNGFTGSTGYTGSLGYTGSQGEIGYTGSKGDTGSTGFTGSQGEVGYSGSVGYTGSAGAGYTGSQGNTGYTGSAGTNGFTGSQGEIGYTGSAGYIGADGYTGSRGDIGYTGSTGYTGSQGDTGFIGSIGYTGSQGELGYTGSIGYTGSQGELGYTGSTGYTGSIGYTGSQGIQGIQGYTGSQGDIGFTGSIGYTGSLPTGIVSNLSNTITIESGYNFLPQDDALQDLGSPTNRFKTLYLSGNTLFVGNVALSDSGGSLTVTQANGYIAPVATSLGLGVVDGQMLLSNSTTTYWHSLYTLSATPPSNPNYGDIWYYTVDDKPYMWVQDSNSSFWFDFSPSAG